MGTFQQVRQEHDGVAVCLFLDAHQLFSLIIYEMIGHLFHVARGENRLIEVVVMIQRNIVATLSTYQGTCTVIFVSIFITIVVTDIIPIETLVITSAF